MSETYAVGRLWAALETAARHPDEATRARAAAKAGRWRAVLEGMADGTVVVGSRTPVAGVPAWVTLEVVTGGFATGRLLAEEPGGAGELNRHHLGDEGQAELLAAVREQRYRVELPEHAALPTVALLLDQGRAEEALDLVAEIAPWLDRLRFTPVVTPEPVPLTRTVHLETAGAVAARLHARTVPPALAAMRATLGVWNPLLDDLVALWSEFMAGDVPPDWSDRRARWLARYEEADRANPTPTRHRHPKSTFSWLRTALEHSDALSPRDLGRVRKALAGTRKHTPAVRAEQRTQLEARTHADVAHEIAARLDTLPADDGILDEATVLGADAVPPSLVRKVRRAREAPVEELVELGVISSGEVLAALLPRITGQQGGFDDPAIAGVHARTYAAFRRRRSLLLVDLEHQIRFGELPWVGALEGFRAAGRADGEPALRWASTLAVSSFPDRILPNPLITELQALARAAGRSLNLVEEVAADIFMGTFTLKWRDAAAEASEALRGSLYAAYYNLPDPAFWAAPETTRVRWRKRTSSRFDDLCVRRAAEAGVGDGARGVAANGAVIEQSQILTTHNLAALVIGLELELPGDLAARVLRRIVALQLPKDDHGALLAVKNLAYAWRQAIFLLSLEPDAPARIDWLADHAPGFLRPAVDGLRHVAGGGRFTPDGRTGQGGRRLLGWTVGGPHWLLADRAPTGVLTGADGG